jgi:hypothetical protein
MKWTNKKATTCTAGIPGMQAVAFGIRIKNQLRMAATKKTMKHDLRNASIALYDIFDKQKRKQFWT